MSTDPLSNARLDARRNTMVWLVLSGATVVSWWLGIERAMSRRQAATVTILAIAMAKVRLVIRVFMNVRTAPRVLKAACDIWLLLLGAAMIGFYWMGNS